MLQSPLMQNDWATENLQTIRNLMERAALYRRAMAPMMIAVGVTGIAAAGLAWILKLEDDRVYVPFWMVVAAISMAEAFYFARREALRQKEPLWSPPMRRVIQAMQPAFFAGLVLPVIFLGWARGENGAFLIAVLPLWLLLYGCGVHAAGFFMPRGFKLFGWCYVFCACSWWACFLTDELQFVRDCNPNWLMGLFFGGGHLAYGIYLYCTEKRGNDS